MKDEDMFRFDFNSLKILKVLGEERNTKQVCERLGIGQPAVSKALNKLRTQFSDPLFTRTPEGLEPTPKCEQLLVKLPQVVSDIDELFKDETTFNPAEYEGDIRIHINSSLCHPLTSILIEELSQLAPKATLQMEDWSYDTEQQLIFGQVDIGVNFYPIQISQELAQHIICYPRFKLCCRDDHPLLDKLPITVENIADSPLILATMPGFSEGQNYIEMYLKRRGFLPNVVLRTDKLDICSHILKKTDAIMPVCEVVKPLMKEERLALIDVDHLDEVTHSPIAYYISHRTIERPYSQWLIENLCRIMNDIKEMYTDPDFHYVYPTIYDEK
ncbi:LysR family transcriptional regulator [Vibrio mexicanus]|uniref:LysR substrate-binding domain-containing protein n=1 Tax=Vibrio mexicanus TaxID=1004326 RepID=UPI00063C369A|nr:LysR family transcriptional regulator [Vibrio mexicanus]